MRCSCALSCRNSILACPGSGLVGLDGLEPSTSRLSGVRSSHLSYRPVFSQVFQFVHLTVTVVLPLTVLLNRSAGFRTFNSTSSSCWSSLDHTASAIFALRCLHRESKIGGDEGIRTLDPLLAGQVLSQLSYTPILLGLFLRTLN